jgi:photosynthetic reaction center cytochrome c subunit
MKSAWRQPLSLLLAAAAALLTAGCERPTPESVQRGYRGLGMVELWSPARIDDAVAANKLPPVIPASPAGGPRVSAVFKNVQVLNDLEVGEFTRLMASMTAWVSPQQGCLYCHAENDMASDAKYTKVVARRMLQMTRSINTDWKRHVANTGVTCFTCHRGQPVPEYVWFLDPGPKTADGPAGNRAGQNTPAPAVGLASLPFDPFTPFLNEDNEIRVISESALPAGDHKSIKQTEWTYALMMHISQALGVNCTFCHNTRSFAAWDASTPQRATAWYSIRLVRELNRSYLDPLRTTFPADRLGPTGDAPKVNCATCHQGVWKPLFGAQMAKDFPALTHVAAAVPAGGDVLAKVLFETGKKDLDGDAAAAIARAVESLKQNAALSVDLSGYADRTGNADRNLQLAKERAFAVRDALASAGIGANRIKLRKPEFVIGGAEADARRVDIVAAK